MEISPYMLFLLLVYSFVFGMSAGVLDNAHKIIRAAFGVKYSVHRFDRLYSINLPFVGNIESGRRSGKIRDKVIFVIIFFQDILLFAYLGCGTVILNYYLNRGQFRLYTIAAVALGFAVYYFTLGKLVTLLTEGILFFIKATLKITFYLVSRPFVVIWGFIVRCVKKLIKNIGIALAKRKIIRYNKDRREELLALSTHGFVDE